jgi:hypothetical protein
MTRKAWSAALSAYRREEAAYAVVSSEYEAVCRTLDCEISALDRGIFAKSRDFDTYGLLGSGHSKDREELIRDTELRITMTDYVEGNPGRGPLSAEERGAIAEKATRLVDDYLAWSRQVAEAKARIYDPAEVAHDAACDKIWTARAKLLSTPAPDASALLCKLDILAGQMIEADEQDAPAVALIRDDAKRLLAGRS